MKRFLLSIVCVLTVFALNAQVSENFSDYTAGGKLAQQAQAMGRDYWTTWSSAPGGAEDGTIAEVDGNKAGSLTFGNDQVLLLGGKTSGVWNFSMRMYVPTGKCGYFNILANFAGTSSTWAVQVYLNKEGTSPGAGTIDAAGEDAASFTFEHDTWVKFDVTIDLDTDNAKMYVDDVFLYEWVYTAGTFGDGCPRVIDAMNIYPPTAGISSFYIDDIVFSTESNVLFETGFDDVAANSYVAQSYPDWWTTWGNAPGGAEDAIIVTDQAASAPQSAKLSWGDDLVFLAGDKTIGTYTVDFDVYIPGTNPAFFNILHAFAGSSSEWAVGVYFNIPTGTTGMEAGTYIQQNGDLTNFTVPSDTWFPVSFVIDLDNDNATISINGAQLLEWQYSLNESGGTGLRQLGAVDFYPPTATSTFYIDNFVYAGVGGGAPIVAIDVTSIDKKVQVGTTDQITVPIEISNSGNSIADFTSHLNFADYMREGEKANFTLQYCNENFTNTVGHTETTPLIEIGAKYTHSYYCGMVGTYISKVSYFVNNPLLDNMIIARVYGQGNADNIPGDILCETTLSNPISGVWNDINLPEPVLLDGQDIWVTFEFTALIAGQDGYAITCDDGLSPLGNGDWIRTNGGSWSLLHKANAQIQNNFMIRAFSEGNTIPACWVSLVGEKSGSILAGQSVTFDVVLDAQGLDVGIYQSNIIIKTNDPNNDYVEIPCTLEVDDGVGITKYTVSDVTTIVYPNPATDMITVESNKNINSIQIINNAGQVVYSTKVNGSSTTVNTSNYSSGVYFIKTNTDAGSKSIKFIVK